MLEAPHYYEVIKVLDDTQMYEVTQKCYMWDGRALILCRPTQEVNQQTSNAETRSQQLKTCSLINIWQAMSAHVLAGLHSRGPMEQKNYPVIYYPVGRLHGGPNGLPSYKCLKTVWHGEL